MTKFVLSALMVAASSQMFAAITPTLVSVTPTGTGEYTWTYRVALAQDQNAVGRSSAPGTTSNAGLGVTSQVSDYFTIYDFSGYVANSATAPNANWSFQAMNIGSTPSDVIP